MFDAFLPYFEGCYVFPSCTGYMSFCESRKLLWITATEARIWYRGIQKDYRQTLFPRAIASNYRYRVVLPEELLFFTETDLWECWQKISHCRYIESPLNSNYFPLQIQTFRALSEYYLRVALGRALIYEGNETVLGTNPNRTHDQPKPYLVDLYSDKGMFPFLLRGAHKKNSLEIDAFPVSSRKRNRTRTAAETLGSKRIDSVMILATTVPAPASVANLDLSSPSSASNLVANPRACKSSLHKTSVDEKHALSRSLGTTPTLKKALGVQRAFSAQLSEFGGIRGRTRGIAVKTEAHAKKPFFQPNLAERFCHRSGWSLRARSF